MVIQMKRVLLSGRNVCKEFTGDGKTARVLNEISTDIYEGDFTVIMGASGAGKSTLLYVLSGMDTISGGKVFYKEREISCLSERQMAALYANEFGFVFQQAHLVSNLTLYENILVAGYVNKANAAKSVQKRAEQLLMQMHVEEAKDRMPSRVSGGEAQRAAIARAIINNPGVLFADEPTGALNKKNTEEVLSLLTALHKKGQSILMVTHDLKAAVRGNRIIYLEDGKILDDLSLPNFTKDDVRNREMKVSKWLTSLQW